VSTVVGETLGEVGSESVGTDELGEVVVDAVVGGNGEGTALTNTATERLTEPLDLLLQFSEEMSSILLLERKRRGKRTMNFLGPTSTEPTGAPRPFDKHNETVSNGLQSSSRLCPVFAATSHILAPSQCMIMPFERMQSEMRMISS
jgi:hypothetical protein